LTTGARQLAGLSDPTTATADELSLVDTINTIIRIAIAVAIVIALSAALEIRRYRQLAPRPAA
jgi:hypothetical protein